MEKEFKWKSNIALFLFGQGFTLFGSMLVHYAIMWHITLKTQSGIMMTFIAMAGSLPMFFITPFGGVWADRHNKKHVINIADASIAAVTLIMAVLFSAGFEFTGLLLVCMVARALGQGVQTPAVSAIIPELVPQEHLTRINGISGGIQSFVMFASPVAGGAMLAVAPIHILMFVDVVSAAVGISILLFFVKTYNPTDKTERKAGAKQYFVEIGQGIRYVRERLFLKKALVLSALFNIMIAPIAVMTPLQVARNYGNDVWTVFGGMPFGAEQRLATLEVVYFVGMMLGGLIIGIWGGFKNKSHTMALSTILLGAGAVGLGLIMNYWVYLLCMGMLGLVMNLFNPPMMAMLQTNVDAAYMGRVFSVLLMMGSLMMPLGMMVWGPLGNAVDIGWILMGTGVFIFIMGFVFIFDKTLVKAGKQIQNPG